MFCTYQKNWFLAAPRNIHLFGYGKQNTDMLRSTWPSPLYPSLPVSDPTESTQAVQLLTLNALLLKVMSFSWETSLTVPLQGRLVGLISTSKVGAFLAECFTLSANRPCFGQGHESKDLVFSCPFLFRGLLKIQLVHLGQP